MILIKLKEHQESFCFLPQHEPKNITNKSKGDVFCGLYFDFFTGTKQLKTSYFIGTCWLEENQLALQVQPKIKDLDYMAMFLKCFKHPIVSKELSKIYQIDFQKPKIALDGDNFEITPLLIVHFLQVVKSIVRKGLKKGYYSVEHNFNAKIKGKIDVADTLKRNIFKGQQHKTVCHYQAFGIDCLENRLLKKALKFTQSYLAKSDIKTEENLKQTVSYCLAPFEKVSDNIDIRTIKQFRNNAFFKEYTTGLKLAKMLLKRFAYNFKNTDTKQQTPPFWIDMSLLFELYTYALLRDNNEVKYQVDGHYGKVDFLIDDIIVDTKYKPKYRGKESKDSEDSKDYKYNIDDIRQLSGYGRDKKIRSELSLNEAIAKCLIIYPNKEGQDTLTDELWNGAEEIKQFKEFKKIGIKLPQST
ncbi:hypothetical protein MNB_SUP05-SYMBIONT-5-912 [hydrothermal vent metagenome]|uniref:McrBC 5-methylcytosine restriction system component n=1 Tax=hydrothermal vent metagenome TaxID=652676 RepID=A0A1W1E2B5_9ZZZZ